MESYKIIYRGGRGEIEEKKSRFIAHILPVSTEEEALKAIAAIKKEYWDARHNCHAFTIGKNFELQRYSDDGEPGGTAGRPILDVLLKNQIHDCLAVVTRYFGGTLLGTGGLVRAYQRSTLEGLSHCTVTEKMPGMLLTVTSDYNSIGKLQYIIGKHHFPTLDARYAREVEIDVLVPAANLPGLLAELTEATGGKVRTEEKGMMEFAIVDGEVKTFPHS